MATETEIESMVVRLVGDGVEYQKMLAEAQKATTEAAQHVEETTGRIEKFTSAVKGFWTGAIQTLSGLGILHFLKEAKTEWQSAEMAQTKLSSVVRANGRDVEKTMKSYEEYATQMQKVTVHSDETIMSLLKQAETFELTGKAAKDTVTDAINLAAATDSSAESMIRFAAAMKKGNIPLAMHMARMIPQLRGITNESEFAAKAQKLMQAGMAAVNAEAKTGAGRAKIFANAYSDMLEEIGKIFSEIPNPIKVLKKEAMDLWLSFSEGTKKTVVGTAAVIAGIIAAIGVIKLLGVVLGVATGGLSIILGLIITGSYAFVQWADSIGGLQEVWNRVKQAALDAWAWLKPIRQSVMSLANTVINYLSLAWISVKKAAKEAWESISGGGAIDWDKIKSDVVDTILLIEYTLTHMDAIAHAIWTRITLTLVGIGEDVAFLFTDQIPAIIKHVPGIFFDAFATIEANFRETIKTMVSNAAHFAKSLPKLLTGRVSIFDVLGGMDMSIEVKNKFRAIKVPKREITELEKKIRESFQNQAGKLMGGFAEFRAQKLKEFGIDPADADKAAEEAEDMGKQIGKAMGDGFKSERFDAVLYNSAEALTRISEFQDKMLEGRASLSKGVNSTATNIDKKIESKKFEVTTATGSASAGASKIEENQLTALEGILAAVKATAAKPPVVLKPANIGDA